MVAAAGGNLASNVGISIYGPTINIGTIGDFGSFSWLSSLPYWIIQIPDLVYINVPLIDRRDIASIIPQLPVGAEIIYTLPEEPGDELSHLVIAESPLPVSPPVVTTNQPDIDMASHGVADWRNDPNHPNWMIGSVPTGGANLNGGNDVSIFDDLGDIFVDWVGGQVNPPGSPGGPAPFDFPTTTPGAPAPSPSPGPGVYPGVTAAACAPMGPSPVWKKVCGVYKWVIPKRRRRRALLTEGDYNSLLRIEGLKVNKNMTAAIAKALTR